ADVLSIAPGSFSAAPTDPRAGAFSDLVMSADFPGQPDLGSPSGDTRLKGLNFYVAPGIFLYATHVAKCSKADFLAITNGQASPHCPATSQVGTVEIQVLLNN